MSSSSEAEFQDDDDDSDFDDVPLGHLKKKKPTPQSNGTSALTPVPSAAHSMSIPKKKKKRSLNQADIKEEGEMSDEDFEPAPKKKKSSSSSEKLRKKKVVAKVKKERPPAPKVKSPVVKTKPKAKKSSAAAAKKEPKKMKKLERAERIAHAMQAFLWWDAPDPPSGCQWGTMEHAGVSFPDPYDPHGVQMLYDGEEVNLSLVEEEAATFYAAMDPDGMHLGNAKTAPIFNKNFFKDFREIILSKEHKKLMKDFKKCDFEPIRRHLNEQKLIKKAITDQEKQRNKDMRNVTLFKYGYCLVDGHIEKVGNYNMEPPGTFRGRGEHPKMGKLKQRVDPEQVSLNVSECARVPPCAVPGHAWGELRHDPQVQWLCQWKENINNQVKYMQLAAQSSFKGKSDRSKYNKAALLCHNIDKIRASYKKKLTNKSSEVRQLATAMWVIDRLALRVGGEKDTDEEADTVGCCSLRVEHLHFDPNEEGGDSREIELEFLGKDSMLFKQTIDFGSALYNDNNGMGAQVYDNFKRFCKRKKPEAQVFESLTPSALNTHLKEIMEGLTAKVFRTYNASKTLQDELGKTEEMRTWSSLTAAQKVVEYNNANREVAILCNHQRSVSKAQETQLENIGNKLQKLKEQKKMLKKILRMLNAGETKKIPKKKDEKKVVEAANKAIERAKRMKQKAVTNEEKIAATEADEVAKQQKRDAAQLKFTQAHLWDKVPSKDQVAKRIQNWTSKIAKMEMDLKHKDDNKEVSLGTSKINYMDPRISVAWCKRNEVPIEKIFSKTLRDKFNWAMAVPPDWEFNGEIGKQG